MCLPMSSAAVFSDNVCSERVCGTSHVCCAAVETALDSFFGDEEPAEPEAGGEGFGEAAYAQDVVAVGEGIKAGRNSAFEGEVAIDIIFQDQKIVLVCQFDNLNTTSF